MPLIKPKSSSQGLGISYSSTEPGTPPRTDRETRDRQGHRSSPALGPTAPRPVRRPTSSRDGGHHTFTTFSAILPPSSEASSSTFHPPVMPDKFVKRRSHTPGPMRSASSSSTASAASRLRKAKSAEVFRKFTKSNDVVGRPYVPLSDPEDDNPESMIGAAVMSQASSRSSRTMEEEIRSVQVSVQYMPERSGSVMTGWTRRTEHSASGPSGNTPRRPLPMEPTTTTIMEMDDTPQSHEDRIGLTPISTKRPPPSPLRSDSFSSDHSEPEPKPEMMTRSLSTPTGNPSPAKPFFSFPEGLDDPPPSIRPPIMDHRQSSVSTGIHSKNAILLSAESGALMLEYSDKGGAGVWKEGQLIIGKGAGLTTTPDTVSIASTADSEEQAMDRVKPKSRPRADSRLSTHTQSGYLKHSKSRSEDDALLARQGTLFHPSSSHDRTSDELGVMLGKKGNRRLSQSKLLPPPDNVWENDIPDGIRLEASKKRKARVEVDIVLERDCVVEGGEVRGRMEVRVHGSKRSEGLRVGAGKIRVVGFEETSNAQRHIFYHHPHPLPQFSRRPDEDMPGISLFASEPDRDGYRLAAEGTHSIPFRLRLPLDGGAKGSFGNAATKGPGVRYVVVGSVKLYLPVSEKRSIAHFYRSFNVLPYLKASTVLAPSREPIEASTESGMGWRMGGDKGRVNLRVALGRGVWLSGQKLWCEVGIHNESSKRIKSLQLAILQTVQTFNPNAQLDPSGRAARHQISKRKSADREALLSQPNVDTDLDACQTFTQQRKVSEQVLESDHAAPGAGRVTGKGWWTGVESGDSGHWDLSISIPSDLISIRRARLVEVRYMLRVSISNSIYVDIPITLIDFLSIDPPPMPGDTPRLPMPQSISTRARMPREDSLGLPDNQKGAFYPLSDPSGSREHEVIPVRRQAQSSRLHSPANEARSRLDSPAERPMSMASDYTEDSTPILPPATEPRRPAANRIMSYLSSPPIGSEETGISSSMDCLSEEADKALLAARRAQGRARSLAAIERAVAREAAHDMAHEPVENEDLDQADDQSEGSRFQPLATPSEEVFKMMGSPEGGDSDNTPRPSTRGRFENQKIDHEDYVDHGPGLHDLAKREHIENNEDPDEDVGNDTVLEDLVHRRPGDTEEDGDWIDESDEEDDEDAPNRAEEHPPSEREPKRQNVVSAEDPLDAGHPIHQAISIGTINPSIDPQLAFMTGEMPHTRDRYARQNRSINDSVATHHTHSSEGSSEIGEIIEARKEQLPPKRRASLMKAALPEKSYSAAGGDLKFGKRASKSSSTPAQSTLPAKAPDSPASASIFAGRASRRAEPPTLDVPPIHQLSPEPEVPELTPSVHSDPGSSQEEPSIESPVISEPEHALRPATSQRSLPQVPTQSAGQRADFAGMDHAPAENLWLPAETLLRNQVNRFRSETPGPSVRPISPVARSTDEHSVDHSTGSSNSHETESSGQTHESLLPSVRTKIAQLEERQEALRRMSLASFGTPMASPKPADDKGLKNSVLRSKTATVTQSAAPSPQIKQTTRPARSRTLGAEDIDIKPGSTSPALPSRSNKDSADPVSHRKAARTPGLAYREGYDDSSSEPEVYQVNSDAGHGDAESPRSRRSHVSSPRSPPAKTKRKSYTAALAPRPTRQTSDDSGLPNPERAQTQRLVVSPTSGVPIAMASVSETGHGDPSASRTPRSQMTSTSASPAHSRSSAPVPGRSRTMGDRPSSYAPMPRPKGSRSELRREKSASSTSTSATTAEAALINRKQQIPRRQTRAQTMYVEGKHANHDYDYESYSSAHVQESHGGVAPTSAYATGDQKYFNHYGGGGGFYAGTYGVYHEPYKSSTEAGSANWVRPADRPDQSFEGVDETEWDKFY
ncbi:hypothetical protein BD324DRAFT_682685 [Kockovaella imperatae]|uniref:Arrestin C-terminal-like domain-containing protein n=1 Tax=Kockovaella imperatae TaxID=4999 RepID=A0A1Y1UCU3_9TREE|nr:hypothetical protein BD324DRAFT_682685 [Kockovaella imperatae]ORX35336.1 hypothetical protein BD324DRAFT_682685 [Kockovaella imperatae]